MNTDQNQDFLAALQRVCPGAATISIPEAAKISRVSPNTLRNMVSAGLLPAVEISTGKAREGSTVRKMLIDLSRQSAPEGVPA